MGREFYILKRRIRWWSERRRFAQVDAGLAFDHPVITHRSLLLRPLKGVDMVLQHNKVTNLGIAVSKINRVVIRPGQVFSIWRMVGRPAKRKGYLDGLVLTNGTLTKGTGGGLCQLGNLIYWMALHSPLTVKERWRHSYDVFPDLNRTIPFACGATLSYNYVDLQLENNTDKSFQINLWLDPEYLNGEITCSEALGIQYEIFETDHHFEHQWWGGYTRHNKIWKRTSDAGGQQLNVELVAENHAIMRYNPLLEN